MKFTKLGRNGPDVSSIGLGCLSFGGIFGVATEEDSFRTMDAAWDQGINFFDVANIYGNGHCETVIGRWLASRPHRPMIATKAGIVNGPPRTVNNDPAYLRAELESSLKRLGVDHVQLFYAHRHAPEVPAEDLAGTMQRLQEEGKILSYGLSEVAPGTVERAHTVHPVTAVQNEYSLWSRQPELGLTQLCARLGITLVAFSPLGRGVFARDIADPARFATDDFRKLVPRFAPDNWPHNRSKLEAFKTYALSRGYEPAALALAWLLDQGSHILPIPGTRTPTHLGEWIGAAEIDLNDDERSGIRQILPVGWAWGDRYSDALSASVERYS
ncbi:aldo/keto reductase [Xinfangfangia sp. CPCC 101601]|uniref:Aldo/keto reductase n=1 Tax=Pseudogemmobacter lacusdianii TaxID=3069608 RepID=A0ABU0VWQ6_9RHOB|nr:aldo/keto reductase [Xinfangfangia sp. CPCC 101601]MDQ2066181.1 aldo/keto reductase [Xinfangfangia sp. CPCC 101601]